jgi:hypothetical protein
MQTPSGTTVCLLVVTLVCLLTASIGHALAGRWSGHFLVLIANTNANNVVACPRPDQVRDTPHGHQ